MPTTDNPHLKGLSEGLDHLFVNSKAGKRLHGFMQEYNDQPITGPGKLSEYKLKEFLADSGVSPRSVHQITDAEAIQVATIALGEDSMVEPVTVHRYVHEDSNVVLVTPGYKGPKNPTTAQVEQQENPTLDWVEIDGCLSVRERWNTALDLFYVYHYLRERGMLPEAEIKALREMAKRPSQAEEE